MKTHTKILIWICIVLAFVSLVWLSYNSSMYIEVTRLFTRPKIYVKLMTVGLLFFTVSHLVIILVTILNLKNSQGMLNAAIILIVFGVISFIFLLFHFVALDQLEEDFYYKDPYRSSLRLAWVTQFVQYSFFLYSMIYFIIIYKARNIYISTKSVSREQIFVALNITGIVCSILGIFLVFIYSQAYEGIRVSIVYKIIPYAFVLLPYFLALAGWGIRYFRDRRTGWYDEKQSANINRSGMVALLSSLILMIGLTIVSFYNIPIIFERIDITGVIAVLLLPFYLFVVLFIFSVSALYNFKNN